MGSTVTQQSSSEASAVFKEITAGAAAAALQINSTQSSIHAGLRSYDLVVVICSEGRCALLSGKHVFIVKAGEIAMLRSDLLSETVCFPTNRFSGLLLGVDLGRLPESAEHLQTAAETAMSFRSEKIAVHYTAKSSNPILHPFLSMQTVTEDAVCRLLSALSAPSLPILPTSECICSASQLRIASEAYRCLCENQSRHISTEQLAAQMHISATHLKNSFRLIYGDSLYSFIRTQKMRYAATELRKSERTVLEIAGECGYDNGSKFAQAFRGVFGVTPRAFRQNPELRAEAQILPMPAEV